MKALVISDKEYQTEAFCRLHELIQSYLSQKGFDIEDVQIERDELAYCMGCFGCWIKKPGECVINDRISQINRSYIDSDAVFYLSPIIFGQFSCNMKNVLDRWIPNVLPFFGKRKNGSTMHPPRYEQYPIHIMIGYGDDVTNEEKQLFSDINLKHRNSLHVLIYENLNSPITDALDKVCLKKTGGDI